jgi:acetamidase/formamidase
MYRSTLAWLIAVVLAGSWLTASAQPAPLSGTPDATLRSTPDTVIWGYFAADIPPALRIKSGQAVKIDTVSHAGLLTSDDPVTYFGKGGIAPDQVLKDAIDIYKTVKRPKGASAHVLTGPIYIDEAEPGDMLEVRIVALEHRVPYGVNNSNRGTGVLPDLLSGPTIKIIKFDLQRNVALFSNDIEVPLSPFMGIMAVAPSREAWLISSLQFIVHKGAGKSMVWPRAEDAANYYAMGIDVDLNVAMREAAKQTVDFLRERFGLSAADAYALASVGVDFRVAEAVDSTQMVYGMIPKKLFKNNPDYWSKR